MQLSSWLKDTLTPFLSGQQSSRQKIVVFSADTDRTQAYVFESNHLPEIRGASRQVAERTEREKVLEHLEVLGFPKPKKDDESTPLLFAGGGSILALLPTIEIAEKLETRLAQDYARETGVVTITCAYKEFDATQLTKSLQSSPLPTGHSARVINSFFGQNAKYRPDRFGRAVSNMSFQLRRKKQQKPSVPFIEIMPFAQICTSCQVRPATKTVRDGELVCDVCAGKSKQGASGERRYWLEKLQNAFKPYGVDTTQIEYPQDIEELTGDEPVAVIYADGDSIGEKLHSFSTASEYEKFSQYLIDATYRAVCKTIKDVGLRTQGKCNWEIITIGGDDVLILVPAEFALDFAIQLSQNFTAHMTERGHVDTRMSVGFTVGKVKTPIRLLYEGAKSALKNAKRRAKEVNEACVDWQNIIKEGHPSTGTRTHSTTRFSDIEFTSGKPYTLTDAIRLQESVRRLKGAGLNSQLYNIASELQQSAARGSLYYYYQRARLSRERRTYLEEIEKEWQSNSFPWITREDAQYTIFLDILDLL